MNTTKENPPSIDLLAECKRLGIETDHHESDLYMRDCPAARDLLQRAGWQGTPFQDQITGQQWLEVAFAYLPFWQTRKAP